MADTGKEFDVDSLTQTFQIQNVRALDVLMFTNLARTLINNDQAEELDFEGDITPEAFSYAVQSLYRKIRTEEGYDAALRCTRSQLGRFRESFLVNTGKPEP